MTSAAPPAGNAGAADPARGAGTPPAPGTRGPAGSADADPAQPPVPDDAFAVLRARLDVAARELAERAEELETRRQEVFGGGEIRLEGAGQIRTELPSVPADIAPVGDLLLFAANPAAEVGGVGDVFRLRRADDPAGPPAELPGLLDDPQFVRDVSELYRYYRTTRVLRLRAGDGRLMAVFRTGAGPADVRALSWRISRDGRPVYEGASRESTAPAAAHTLRWTPAGREHHVPGRPPLIALTSQDGGRLTLGTTGGTLRVTTGESDRGCVHEEPVEDALQSLADASVAFAVAGPLVLLRVRPYREDADRYFVVNTRTARIERVDAVARGCLPLPEGQGVVFPGGYALADGGMRTFDLGAEEAAGGLEFERLVRSPGGEDVLFVYHAADDGRRLLLPYRVIRAEAGTPLHARGWALYEDGTLLTLRAAPGGEPARVHTVQRRRTPYAAEAGQQPVGDGVLARIGNPDLVRLVSDALALSRAARRSGATAAVYSALAAAADRLLDAHPWLPAPAARGGLAPESAVPGRVAPGDEPVGQRIAALVATVGDSARAVLDSYARVRDLTARAARAATDLDERVTAIGRRVRGEDTGDATQWVARLAELRRMQGDAAGLREMRYADRRRLDALDGRLAEHYAEAARRAAGCLADDAAFDPFRERAASAERQAAAIGTAADAEPVAAELDRQTAALTAVTDLATALDGADATVRTRILDLASGVLAGVNRARAVLQARRRELIAAESAAEFAAESAVLAQEVSGALAAAGTPEACDEHLGRLLARVENLAARFAESPEQSAALDERRTRIERALTERRQTLSDERARRVRQLTASAERVLDTVRRRAAALDSPADLQAYFAGDPMAGRYRQVAADLREMGEPARAAELDAALAAARQDATRALRDRLDLSEDGGATVRLGRHRFPVTARPPALALVPHGDGLALTVPGTGYLTPVDDPELAAARPLWTRTLPSESADLYRAEYLAGCLLLDQLAAGTRADAAPGSGGSFPVPAGAARDGGAAAGGTPAGAAAAGTPASADHVTGFVPVPVLPPPAPGEPAGERPHGALPVGIAAAEEAVRRAVAARPGEGYERGVHDHDAALILRALAELAAGAGLLRHPADVRAAARLFWCYGLDAARQSAWTTRARSLARAAAVLGGGTGALTSLAREVAAAAEEFLSPLGLLPPQGAAPIGAYLVAELADERPGFAESRAARTVMRQFAAALGGPDALAYKEVLADLDALGDDLAARRQLAHAWLTAACAPACAAPDREAPLPVGDGVQQGLPGGEFHAGDIAEAVAGLLCAGRAERYPVDAPLTARIEGLLGAHPRVAGGVLTVRLDELLSRVRRFREHDVPAYTAYQRARDRVLAAERGRLALDALRPRPPATFVRNRLLDEVYLPLVGDSLARQFGPSGGLLMLMSPPGYGKSSLVEYVAARLGLALVTVFGPALGTGVTSLDPACAPDAASRREVEKIDLALRLGTGVMLYLDDIQHTSPELLQKFIPLCDAQRRIEGAHGTYDLRGRRFAVCMAGNPYTASGAVFRVPDMLANRADVWNLGDVLAGRGELFALSCVENALTANPVLAPLAARESADLDVLLALAAGDPAARPDALRDPLPPADREEITAVLRHLLRARRTVLAVNAAYIASAGQSPAARTEPPFLLQGSYRTMNRIAARLLPAMDDAEVEAVVGEHYRAEAQTLAAGAEAALLKLGELRGTLTAAEAARWEQLKEGAAAEAARLRG